MGQKDPLGPPEPPFPEERALHAPLRFSTSHVAPCEQFELWRDAVSTIVDSALPADVGRPDGYAAEITAFHLGSLVFSSEHFGALSYELSPQRARRNPVDHWFITLTKKGNIVSRMGDDIVESSQGTIGVRSLSRPFAGRASAMDMIFLYIPRNFHPALTSVLDSMNNTAGSGGLRDLLREFLLLLERQLPTLAPQDLTRLVESIRAMLVACLSPSAEAFARAQSEISATLRQRARHYIRRNIHSPALSPDELCLAMGISRTQLYRLFEQEGGVARQIRLERLVLAHAALTDPTDRRLISQIAQAFGFTSPTEFGRTFREHFGYTPHDVRKSLDGAYKAPSASAGGDSFTEWMIGLGGQPPGRRQTENVKAAG